MKKILAVLLSVIMLASFICMAGCQKDETPKLTVATEAGFAPYEFFYENEIVGVDIEIMKAVAKKLGYELVINDMDFNNIVAAVQSGKADVGAAGISIKPDRKESVDFSIPYASTAQYVIVTSDKDIPTVEDLAGKQIGVQEGTTSDGLIQTLIDDKTLDGSSLTTYKAPAIAAAALGKIDAVVTDKLTAQNIVTASNGAYKTAELLKADGSQAAEIEEYGIAVAKGNKELLDVINEVLDGLLKDGSIEKWTKEYTEKGTLVEE